MRIGGSPLDGLGRPVAQRSHSYDHVYRRLRQALLTQRVPPGTRLVETEIADRLQVSRTPVREALRRLESEGFAQRAAGRGLVSADFGPEEISDIFLVRAELDRLAARLACERAKPEQWDEPRALLTRMQHTIQRFGVSSPEFDDIHGVLHTTLYRIAFSSRMAGWIDNQLRYPLEIAAELSYGNPAVTEPPLDQHERLIDALSSGDVSMAVAGAEEHSRRSATDADRSRRTADRDLPH